MAQVRRREPEAQEGRDPQGREERLQRRPRAVLHRGVHRSSAARSSSSRPTAPATRTSAPSSPRSRPRSPRRSIVPGYYTEAGLIARQARELGITVPLLGGDGWESEKLIEIGGEALNGCYYSNHFALDNPDPRAPGLPQGATATSSRRDPDAIGGLAYDAANVLFAVAARSSHEQDAAAFKALVVGQGRHAGARKAADSKLRDLIAATTNYAGRHRHHHARRRTATPRSRRWCSRSRTARRCSTRRSTRRSPARVRVPPAARQRHHLGQRLRPDRARLHDGLRHPAAHQFRARRRLHAGRVLRLLRRALRSRAGADPNPLKALAGAAVAMVGCGLVGIVIERVAYKPVRKSPRLVGADHRDRRLAAARERRHAAVRRRPQVLPADHPVAQHPARRRASRSRTSRSSSSWCRSR